MGPRVVALSLLLLGVTGTAVSATASQAVPPRQLQAGRAVDPPVVDGRLDDAIWAVTEPAGDFLQRDPVEGDPASEPSLVRIAYDDEALYVGARLFDGECGGGSRARGTGRRRGAGPSRAHPGPAVAARR